MKRLFRNPRTWAIVAAVAGVATVYTNGEVNIGQALQLVISAVFGGSLTAVAIETKPEG